MGAHVLLKDGSGFEFCGFGFGNDFSLMVFGFGAPKLIEFGFEFGFYFLGCIYFLNCASDS